jgi:hypothetical protein
VNKRERTKMINHLLDVNESVAYLQERVRLNDGITLAVLRKNLFYALRNQEELCKTIGLKDSTSLSKKLQQEEVI